MPPKGAVASWIHPRGRREEERLASTGVAWRHCKRICPGDVPLPSPSHGWVLAAKPARHSCTPEPLDTSGAKGSRGRQAGTGLPAASCRRCPSPSPVLGLQPGEVRVSVLPRPNSNPVTNGDCGRAASTAGDRLRSPTAPSVPGRPHRPVCWWCGTCRRRVRVGCGRRQRCQR